MLITASFGFLLPSNLIDSVPSNHALNVHPSLLPDYRGAAPVQWAIAHGDTHSGVTVQSLSKGKFDHGSILAQKPLVRPFTELAVRLLLTVRPLRRTSRPMQRSTKSYRLLPTSAQKLFQT